MSLPSVNYSADVDASTVWMVQFYRSPAAKKKGAALESFFVMTGTVSQAIAALQFTYPDACVVGVISTKRATTRRSS